MQWQRIEQGTKRGVRFPIAVPLRYRPASEVGWCEGESVNISGSGVLFHANRPLELLTPVEISLTLSADVAGGPVRFDFRGRVVRALAPQDREGRVVVAVSILEYRFVKVEPDGGQVS